MPPALYPQPHAEQGAVGTLVVGGAASTPAPTKNRGGRKKGQVDKKKRARRHCKTCKQTNCPGTNGRGCRNAGSTPPPRPARSVLL